MLHYQVYKQKSQYLKKNLSISELSLMVLMRLSFVYIISAITLLMFTPINQYVSQSFQALAQQPGIGAINGDITNDFVQFYVSEVKVKNEGAEKIVDVKYIIKNLGSDAHAFDRAPYSAVKMKD